MNLWCLALIHWVLSELVANLCTKSIIFQHDHFNIYEADFYPRPLKRKDAMRSLEGWVFLKARISVSNSNVDLEFYKPFFVNQSTRSDLPAQFRFPR